jgi:PKHD-type hydroxylase
VLLNIPSILDAAAIAECRSIIDAGDWVDGNETSGYQSALAKNNMQLAEGSPAARRAGDAILDHLGRNSLFFSAALPLKVFPPLFNRYSAGQSFDTHVDNAIRQLRGTNFRLRSDLSATLFLSNPEDYDGGELLVETSYGPQSVKLPAGHLALYPASTLHRVQPVTRGTRVASFFWIQSMVRDAGQRELLFDLDIAIQRIVRQLPDPSSTIALTGVYQNLLRRWADS